MVGKSIKVSVIMACYNSSAYLDDAVESLLNQTLSDLELILIDDCSMDNTLDIAKRYQSKDNRISVLKLPVNSGPAIARNIGLSAARGEWIGILDSDDVAMPTRFDEQMRVAESNKDLVMIGSNCSTINKNGDTIKWHKYPTAHKKLVKRLYSFEAFPPHSSMVYKRCVVEQLCGFNKRYLGSEDYDLWLRLSEVGKVTSIDKPLVKIRKHEQNISNSEGGMREIRFSIAASVCHFLRSHGVPDPSSYSDEIIWYEFLAWIDKQINEQTIFERRNAWAEARTEYFALRNRLTGTLRFGFKILRSGYASSLVWEKIFSTSLPRFLAREWMKRSCVV